MSGRIFISYRRDDTKVYAQTLAMELGHHFGEENVFLDVAGIKPSEDWAERIDQAIRSANVVLVVIGRKWLSVTGKDGNRRLDDPEDIVRNEIIQALDRVEDGVKVIPVLVDGASMPGIDDLPEALARIQRYNAVSIRDGVLIKETRDLVKAVKEMLDPDNPVSQDIVLRDLGRRLRYRRLCLASAACLGVLVFFAGWVGLIDRNRSGELWTVWLGNARSPNSFREEIALITMDAATEQSFGARFGDDKSLWRRKHAELIDKLSAAGARVIAFDIFFKGDEDEADERFAEAAKTAARKGCAVLIGARDFTTRDPPFPRKMGEAVSGWGNVGVEKRMRFTVAVTLATLKRKPEALQVEDPTGSATVGRDPKDPGKAVVIIPALSLQCLAAYRDRYPDYKPAVRFNPLALKDQVQVEFVRTIEDRTETLKLDEPIAISCFEIELGARNTETSIPIREDKDAYATMALDLSPIKSIRAQTRRYEEVLQLPADAATSTFAGKIVLIGWGPQFDKHGVRSSLRPEERLGVELHADAVSALLDGKSIHGLPGHLKLLFIIGLFLLGALVKTRLDRRKWYWHWAAFLGLVLVYYQVSMYYYAQQRLLLSLLDGILAFSLSFFVVGKIRRLFP